MTGAPDGRSATRSMIHQGPSPSPWKAWTPAAAASRNSSDEHLAASAGRRGQPAPHPTGRAGHLAHHWLQRRPDRHLDQATAPAPAAGRRRPRAPPGAALATRGRRRITLALRYCTNSVRTSRGLGRRTPADSVDDRAGLAPWHGSLTVPCSFYTPPIAVGSIAASPSPVTDRPSTYPATRPRRTSRSADTTKRRLTGPPPDAARSASESGFLAGRPCPREADRHAADLVGETVRRPPVVELHALGRPQPGAGAVAVRQRPLQVSRQRTRRERHPHLQPLHRRARRPAQLRRRHRLPVERRRVVQRRGSRPQRPREAQLHRGEATDVGPRLARRRPRTDGSRRSNRTRTRPGPQRADHLHRAVPHRQPVRADDMQFVRGHRPVRRSGVGHARLRRAGRPACAVPLSRGWEPVAPVLWRA